MSYLVRSVLLIALCAFPSLCADDVVTAVAGTVKAVDKAAKTVAIKTADGTEHTFHVVDHALVHGVKATGRGGKDAFLSMKEGDEVVVHYTAKGAVETAHEFDHIGADGLKTAKVTINKLDHAAKVVSVKTEEGADDTYHVTGNAMRETGKGIEKGTKVTVYYSEEGGKKIVHFFKE